MLEHSFMTRDGASLRFLERPAATARPVGTVVLLPSLFFGAHMFDRVATELPTGLRIICPDHRGQRGSASGAYAPSIERLCEDEIELIDSVVEGSVHLVGSSMGGYVALALAARRPDILATCVLSCCTAQSEQTPERFAALEAGLRDRGAAALVETLLATMLGGTYLAQGEDLPRWRKSFAAIDGRIADAVHGVFARASFEEKLGALTMPLLLISGAQDRAKCPSDMQFIADRVPGSRHVVVAEAGHTPPVETPERFAAELVAFWRASGFDIGASPMSACPSPRTTNGTRALPSEPASPTNGQGFGPNAHPFKDMPVEPAHLFEVVDGVVMLRGSVSASSGSKAFPPREVCLETGARDMQPMIFGPRGTLYSFSTVHVSSSRPTPYTIGYVDFENGVRVLAPVEAGGQALACDQPVELGAEGDRWFVTPVRKAGS